MILFDSLNLADFSKSLCWTFLNRLMKSEDDYKKRVEELEGELRDEVSDAIKKNTESAKTLKETILMLFSKK